MEELIAYLNPWWKTGKVPEHRVEDKIPRQTFKKVKENINRDKVATIIGPRSSGKTTLVYQLIDALLDERVDPKRILYFTFDVEKKVKLKEIFDVYTAILGEPMDKLRDKVYVFLDEIQKLDNWGDEIKFWYDLKLKMKITISGSSTHGVLRGSGESLVGRVEFYWLYPLTFKEFLTARMKNLPVLPQNNYNIKTLKRAYYKLLPLKSEIVSHFNEYLLKGGFPEVVNYDMETAWSTLRIYNELIISRDILSRFEIKNTNELKSLVYILAEMSSERINYSRIASMLGIKIHTLKNYLYYLESALLIKLSYVYSPRRKISERKEKKVYFVDHGLRNCLIMKPIENLEKRRIVENVVFTNVLISKTKTETVPETFYWIDKDRKEVDVIFGTVPIEVKYSDKIDKKELKGIHRYLEMFEMNEGLVLTKGLLELRTENDKKLIFIPVWLFLLMLP